MEQNPNPSKKIIREFLDEQKITRESMLEEIDDNMERIFIKTGWASYNSGDIDDAISIYIKLNQYLKNKNTEPTAEEKDFIDTIKDAIKKRNQA